MELPIILLGVLVVHSCNLGALLTEENARTRFSVPAYPEDDVITGRASESRQTGIEYLVQEQSEQSIRKKMASGLS